MTINLSFVVGYLAGAVVGYLIGRAAERQQNRLTPERLQAMRQPPKNL